MCTLTTILWYRQRRYRYSHYADEERKEGSELPKATQLVSRRAGSRAKVMGHAVPTLSTGSPRKQGVMHAIQNQYVVYLLPTESFKAWDPGQGPLLLRHEDKIRFKQYYYPLFFRLRNWATARLRILFRVTQLIRTRFESRLSYPKARVLATNTVLKKFFFLQSHILLVSIFITQCILNKVASFLFTKLTTSTLFWLNIKKCEIKNLWF